MKAAPPSLGIPDQFSSIERDHRMFGQGVVVLMYHKVAAPLAGTQFPTLYVHPGQFERQVNELLTRGGECVAYEGIQVAAARGTNGFCLTFDDGFCNVFENALPILTAHGLRGGMQFLVGSQIGGQDKWDQAIGEPAQTLMDAGQIREWLAAGQSIGAHTMTHPRLAEIPLADARREIFDSKKVLEDTFGREISHFCYPYGSYNEAVIDLVAEAGYHSACTVEFGATTAQTLPYAIPRIMATDLPPAWKTAAKKLLRRFKG